MNDTRWSMTSVLLFLGVASLIGGSVVCAAAAPVVLHDLAIIDFRHVLRHLEQGVMLLGIASGCIIGALVCALVLDGMRSQPTIRAPRAWSALWGVRSNPLDVRMFAHGQNAGETLSPADLGLPVHVRTPEHYRGAEAAFAPGDEAVAIALGKQERALATPAIRHGRVRGAG